MTEATGPRKPRLYLAGPMRTLTWFNFPAFDSHRDHLRSIGWDVVSPADIDRCAGFDAMTLPQDFDWGSVPEAAGTLDEIMLRDIEALETCDAIFMLTGWEDSSGANRELAEARKLGLREFYEDVCASPSPSVMMTGVAYGEGSGRIIDAMLRGPYDAPEPRFDCGARAVELMREHIDAAILEAGLDNGVPPCGGKTASMMSAETRITDALTGGQKGAKAERYDLLPVEPMAELARHYGVGAKKYADHNYRKGYKWSLSYAALQRHLNAFWRGEDIDAETGSKHVIAAAFHCLALAEYMDTRQSHDDRYKREVAP